MGLGKYQLNVVIRLSAMNSRYIHHKSLRGSVDGCIPASAPLLDLRLLRLSPILKSIGSHKTGGHDRAELGEISLELVSPEVCMKCTKESIAILLGQTSEGKELRTTILQGQCLPRVECLA